MTKQSKNSGFTMIEIAVVIAIIAFVVGSIIFVTQARTDASRIFTTKSRLQLIMDSIDSYVANYGHIPCPADPASLKTDYNYGYGVGTNTGTCVKGVNIGTLSSGSRIMRGMVPFETLFPALDAQVVVDGWGNRFNYIVTERYTTTQYFSGTEPSFAQSSTTEQGGGYIICTQGTSCAATTNNLVENNGTTKRGDVAYILYSSGPTGHASHQDRNPATMQANTLGYSTTEDEENGNYTTDGNKYIQSMPKSSYQDILIYKHRWQLPTFVNGS